MNVDEAVKYVLKKCKTNNPLEIAKHLNVIIVTTKLINIRGFYQYWKRNHIIYLDEGLTSNEINFVLAHELGHMLMHKNSNAMFLDSRTFFSLSSYEKEANSFAVELLLPNSLLKEYRNISLYAIAQSVGIPNELAQLKIRNLQSKIGNGCRFSLQ